MITERQAARGQGQDTSSFYRAGSTGICVPARKQDTEEFSKYGTGICSLNKFDGANLVASQHRKSYLSEFHCRDEIYPSITSYHTFFYKQHSSFLHFFD
ncbi:hypothetical protein RB195_014214 [Necator americanus]|uniref:Uncharacterized protein n=1 Tax=Necator americanus TaxID=51031 RepID=A0ABR1DZ34_NECAM